MDSQLTWIQDGTEDKEGEAAETTDAAAAEAPAADAGAEVRHLTHLAL